MHNPELHFGPTAHPILRELQNRIDALPKESLNFVAALMSEKVIATPPLSDLIFGMIYIRNGISIEPIHEALTTMVHLRNSHTEPELALYREKQALICSCGVQKTAACALQFVVELQSLLETVN
jgi:hypothetical protein